MLEGMPEGSLACMENWRLIIDEPLTGAMNMAVDEAIMMAVQRGLVPPTVRFYRWSPPAVTLGYFQNLDKEVDLGACRESGIDVVRRLTGGRAVLHHRELTYSLVGPEDNSRVKGTILQSYLSISRGLLKGLQGLGVRAQLAEGKKPGESMSAACFDAPSWYEMVVEGRKLVGSAQTRRYGCLLQHGSVPVHSDADLLFSVLNFSNEKVRQRAKSHFRAKAVSLHDILGYDPDFETICESFINGFETELGIRLSQERLSGEEAGWARELCEKKYGTVGWNSRR